MHSYPDGPRWASEFFSGDRYNDLCGSGVLNREM